MRPDLAKIIAGAVAEQLQERFDALEAGIAELAERVVAPPPLLDRRACATWLRVSLRQLDNLRDQGLPELRVGDAPRFQPSEVLRWLRSHGSSSAMLHVVPGGGR